MFKSKLCVLWAALWPALLLGLGCSTAVILLDITDPARLCLTAQGVAPRLSKTAAFDMGVRGDIAWRRVPLAAVCSVVTTISNWRLA